MTKTGLTTTAGTLSARRQAWQLIEAARNLSWLDYQGNSADAASPDQQNQQLG
jgi:hypothetical protein